MKIEAFERNAEDMVVAISGDVKRVLSWDFIVEHKPQIGDYLGEAEDFVKAEAAKIEEFLFEDENPLNMEGVPDIQAVTPVTSITPVTYVETDSTPEAPVETTTI